MSFQSRFHSANLGTPCVVAVALLQALIDPAGAQAALPTTRPAACAGSWYPGEAEALGRQIDAWMDAAAVPPIAGKPIAIIAPHAGYRFSGPTAAAAYRCLRNQSYDRVIVLAFSHRAAGAYEGVQVPTQWNAYGTPLGSVPIDTQAVQRLSASPGFVALAGIDREEHSLELQVPFLQRALKSFRLVPLLVGRMSNQQYTQAAEALAALLDENTLLVASSDFTHFGPSYDYEPFKADVPGKLGELAEKSAAPLLNADFDGFFGHLAATHDTICGRGPIGLLLRTLAMRGGALGARTATDSSGHLLGEWTNSVTYQSFVYVPRPGTLDDDQRRQLLVLARETVTAVLNRSLPPDPKPDNMHESLAKPGACFVTLQNRGALRGCIGNMIAEGPLYRAVIRNAIAAATEDERFADHPVTAAELPQIHIEISYLTPMKPIAKPDEIIIGRHGLLIAAGGRRGVLLPQVAYERGWLREEFLAQVCRKAGLPPNAWKLRDAKLYSFEAEVFGEPTAPAASKPGP